MSTTKGPLVLRVRRQSICGGVGRTSCSSNAERVRPSSAARLFQDLDEGASVLALATPRYKLIDHGLLSSVFARVRLPASSTRLSDDPMVGGVSLLARLATRSSWRTTHPADGFSTRGLQGVHLVSSAAAGADWTTAAGASPDGVVARD